MSVVVFAGGGGRANSGSLCVCSSLALGRATETCPRFPSYRDKFLSFGTFIYFCSGPLQHFFVHRVWLQNNKKGVKISEVIISVV